jgi:hypothetical protein
VKPGESRSPGKKFIPKVSPNDYHRFIYKCHQCLLGFKRRGMLVNHLAKRHPDVQPDQVPELNLPILRTQRDYYCQYCDKVRGNITVTVNMVKAYIMSTVLRIILDVIDPYCFLTPDNGLMYMILRKHL